MKAAAHPTRSAWRRHAGPGAAAAVFLGFFLAGARAESLPDRPTAASLLDHFRRTIWAEPIYAELQLREMPRRGDEHLFRGHFWGGRNETGPVTRIELDPGTGAYSRRFLIQGGRVPQVWECDAGGKAGLADDVLLKPLVPGVEMTPFDVLPMPFLFWMDSDLIGLERIRGRPSYVFAFTPDGDFAAHHPDVKSVRAYLDTQYDALVQSEVTGPSGQVSRTLSLLDLRKVGDRWIPKDLDVRSEATRNKTRLSLTAVAMGADPGPAAFDPAHLGAEIAPPAKDKILRVDQ